MTYDRILFVFGVGFLAANLVAVAQFALYLRRRSAAVLVWPPVRPALSPLVLLIAAVLGGLILYNLAMGQARPSQLFGESMMFLYYAFAVRLKTRVRVGFYRDGVWTDTGFVPYRQVDAVAWHDKPNVSLVVVSRRTSQARRLTVPGDSYGAARRALQDRIAAHDLTLTGAGLGLGLHDGAEDV